MHHMMYHPSSQHLQLQKRVADLPRQSLLMQALLHVQTQLVADRIAAEVLHMQHPLRRRRHMPQGGQRLIGRLHSPLHTPVHS